ncbi:MAG: hypothetical protein HQK51_00910 [Oligoflexia bacterium]|nr:hypothetical protein [Oligoflexia bacterium]
MSTFYLKTKMFILVTFIFYSIVMLSGCKPGVSLIIASDPQFVWRCSTPECRSVESSDKNKQSFLSNSWQSTSIAKLSRELKYTTNNIWKNYAYEGLIINGDLTDFGNPGKGVLDSAFTGRNVSNLGHLMSYYSENPRITANGPVMLGLGNHDYRNNVNDCGNDYGGNFGVTRPKNACVIDMIDYLDRQTRINIGYARSAGFSMDFKIEKSYTCAFAHWELRGCSILKWWGCSLVKVCDWQVKSGETHKGSLAYSFDIPLDLEGKSRIHVIQLNETPGYSTKFSSYQFPVNYTYDITNSINWLNADLMNQKLKGGNVGIIINMHDIGEHPDELTGFKNILGSYANLSNMNFLAIFAGHFHEISGYIANYDVIPTNSRIRIPVFFSGSSEYNRYLRVRAKWNEIVVEFISSVQGSAKNVPQMGYGGNVDTNGPLGYKVEYSGNKSISMTPLQRGFSTLPDID